MGPLNTILLVAWAISAVALIVLVLMHSGKGTGVSDMIASSMYNANAGSGVWEKNLDRLTVIAAVIFMATIVIFMLTYPLGTVSSLGSSPRHISNAWARLPRGRRALCF